MEQVVEQYILDKYNRYISSKYYQKIIEVASEIHDLRNHTSPIKAASVDGLSVTVDNTETLNYKQSLLNELINMADDELGYSELNSGYSVSYF